MKTIKPLNLKIIGSDLEALATAKGIIVVLINLMRWGLLILPVDSLVLGCTHRTLT